MPVCSPTVLKKLLESVPVSTWTLSADQGPGMIHSNINKHQSQVRNTGKRSMEQTGLCGAAAEVELSSKARKIIQETNSFAVC